MYIKIYIKNTKKLHVYFCFGNSLTPIDAYKSVGKRDGSCVWTCQTQVLCDLVFSLAFRLGPPLQRCRSVL